MISINLYEIAFQIINFLILLYLLNRFLTKPLSQFLTNRSESIKQNIEAAESSRTDAEKILKEQKELLKQAHQESQEIRKKAEESSKKELKKQLVMQKKSLNNT